MIWNVVPPPGFWTAEARARGLGFEGWVLDVCDFVGTCTPQDLAPSVLNQIARRDLHWHLLPVKHVLVYSACDLMQAWPSKKRDRELIKKNRDRDLIKEMFWAPRVD
jgi:hypothetical protein